MRAYFSGSSTTVLQTSTDEILGILVRHHPFPDDQEQKWAWIYEIQHFKEIARDHPEAHFFFEFSIPRMGKRADAVIVSRGVIFVVEYKVGASQFASSALAQVLDYALDLKNFHESSHNRIIVPIVVATVAFAEELRLEFWEDKVSHPICANRETLSVLLRNLADQLGTEDINPEDWERSPYKPTPTIIEAAQALYQGHDVKDISRSEAGAENLSRTANYVISVIERAKLENFKAICFVTGVPGSGKTLAGLTVANGRMRAHDEEHAVFLSGNGPLVAVLREALARNESQRQRDVALNNARRHASAFIQNIHHFRDEYLRNGQPPVEKVAVFDEAQRAWTREQTSKFMREKRGKPDFNMSEPEFLLSVMDRHPGWCVVVCLIGGGQEINTGEAGLDGWVSALRSGYGNWQIHVSDQLMGDELNFATGDANGDTTLD